MPDGRGEFVGLTRGEVFDGAYEVLRCLSSDAWVHHYLARDSQSRAEVSLMVFVGNGSQARDAWFERLRKLSLVRHPNIREVLNLGVCNQRPFFVARHYPGNPLAGERLPYSRLLTIAGQLIEALSLLHRHDLCHGALRRESCRCIESAGEPDAIVIDDVGLRIVTTTDPREDIRALARLLSELADPQQVPERFFEVVDQAAKVPNLEQFAATLDQLSARRRPRTLAVAGLLLGAFATTAGLGWWLAQRSQ